MASGAPPSLPDNAGGLSDDSVIILLQGEWSSVTILNGGIVPLLGWRML